MKGPEASALDQTSAVSPPAWHVRCTITSGRFKPSRQVRLVPGPEVGGFAMARFLVLLLKIKFLRHPNEISYGANPKFLHHAAAMNFDGLLDGAQVGGNLLVGASCDDMN